jgi:hypothetical protein
MLMINFNDDSPNERGNSSLAVSCSDATIIKAVGIINKIYLVHIISHSN